MLSAVPPVVHAAARGRAVEPLTSIRAAAQSYVRSQLAQQPGIAKVSAGKLDGRLRLARCAGKLQAGLPAGAQLRARSTVAVSCPGPVHWTIYVPVTVERRVPVLVLRHAVARGAHLSAADVTRQTRTITGLGAAYLGGVDALQSRVTRRPLAAGTTLTAGMFAPDLIVRRGQKVTLLAEDGPIEVRAAGRALQDGAAGTRLEVQNLSSKKVVEGVVESADVVRVTP